MNTLEVAGGTPILSWCAELDAGALAQAHNLARLPFLVSHVALMPDAHKGYGMPIGGVIGTSGVIIPQAVGKDIGCGMRVTQTSLHPDQLGPDMLRRLMGEIRRAIPLGFVHHAKPQPGMPDQLPSEGAHAFWDTGEMCVVEREYASAERQLGTLGGGNHFIEIQKSDTNVYVMLHSGSRNLGKQVADHYDKVAKKLNERWHVKVLAEHALAFLPMDYPEGWRYQAEMHYCLRFAKASRELMMTRIKDILVAETGCEAAIDIDVHHNYARMEHHFGRNVMVHRKGATSARLGELGIIPGSQGTASYIVKGLGNPASLESCSHGAGRRMGRKQACRELDLKAEQKRLDDMGVIHSVRNVGDLEEAAGAYKDIDEVMAAQTDLIDVVEKLTPMAVIKA